MSHKDAPPETAEQAACREWWQRAQPHIKRAWGRGKNGDFLAEESLLLRRFFGYAQERACLIAVAHALLDVEPPSVQKAEK